MTNFDGFGLDSKILQAIQELSFLVPTPIQQQVIPQLQAEKRDVIALAQTGTGKTAAFGLPIIQMIDPKQKSVQALILCPTRELCIQITNDLQSFSKYLQKISIVAVYGGSSIVDQIKKIEKGVQIVVATPGRLIDIIERKRVNLSEINWVVLDEADEMLNMGFKDDLDRILEETPSQKSTCLFSATMSKEIQQVAYNFMQNPVEITVGQKNVGADGVEHYYYVVDKKDRYAALKRIVDYNPGIYSLIFCRTKIETQQIADSLIKDGYNADSLHGDLSQYQRDMVMKKFRNKNLQLLVATDVAARGLDVDDLTHVINYNLPDDNEQYTHRSGRTGRAGKNGIAISILTKNETHKLWYIEKHLGKKIEYANVPLGYEVCERQVFHQIENIRQSEVKDSEIEKYLPSIYKQFDDMSKEELIRRVVSMEFNRFLSYYKKSNDLNVVSAKKDKDKKSKNSGTVRMFINIGKMDGIDQDSLKKFILKAVKNDDFKIYDIDLYNSCSFFEASPNDIMLMKDALKKTKFNNRLIKIDEPQEKSKKSGRNNRDFSKRRDSDKNQRKFKKSKREQYR